MTSEDIITKLKSFEDADYKAFHSKLCSSSYPMIGVRIPQIRSLAKEASKTHTVELFDGFKPKYYEEVLFYGFYLANLKLSIEETLPRFVYIAKFFDCWAHVDTVVSSFKMFSKHQDIVWEFMQPFGESDDEFILRTYVIVQMCYFLDNDKNIKRTLDEMVKLDGSQKEMYYVDMAIAWLISVALVRNYELTKKYLFENKFSASVQNKAIQKAIDSFRILAEQKLELRMLKMK